MKKIISVVAALAACAMFLTTEASAATNQNKIGDIVIENPWARATMSIAKTGVAYLTIKNLGTTTDTLIAVQSPVAIKAGVHQSLMEGEVMKMIPVKTLNVLPNSIVMFKPGSYHIMFMGLNTPFKMGAEFPLTLVFEKAGEIKIMVKIMKAGSMGSMKMKPSK